MMAFANAEEAITYYEGQGLLEHAAAVKKLSIEAEQRRLSHEYDPDSVREFRARRVGGR